MKNLLSATAYALQELNSSENPLQSLSKITAVLGSGSDVDRCYIFSVHTDEDGHLFMRQLHEWAKDQISEQIDNPELQNIPGDAMPGIVEALTSGFPLYGLVDDNPSELFRKLMKDQDIISYLFAPILVNKKLWGFIGFDDCHSNELWSENEVSAIQAIANSIAMRIQYYETNRQKQLLLERFEISSNGSGVGVWELDIATYDTYLSKTGYEMFEYNFGDLDFSYASWESSLHPDEKEMVLNELRKLLDHEVSSNTIKYRFRKKNGEYIWVESKGFFRDEERKKLLGTHIDITKFVKQEEIIAEQHAFLEQITSNVHDMVCVHDAKGKLTFVSPSSLIVTGFNPEELLDKSFIDFIHPELRESVLSAFNKISDTNSAQSIEFRMKTKSGAHMWMEGIFSSVNNNRSNTWNIQSSIRNIEDRKQAEIEINKSIEKELELSELKSKFVSMASHQFRTPLAVMHSNAELIESLIENEEIEKEKIFRITKTLRREIFRITELMENILIFGKGDIKPNISPDPIDIRDHIEGTLQTYFSQEMLERKCVVMVEDGTKSLHVKADELLLTHLIMNLVSNAYKYSPKRPAPLITISDNDSDPFIAIRVDDFGIGIPADEVPKVFDSFFRATNTVTFKGSGLGLVLCKEFAEKLGGSIFLKSKLDKGTSVTLLLPKWG